MNKKIIIEIVGFFLLIIVGYWTYFYSGLEQKLLYLIFLNVVVYLIRTVLVNFSDLYVKNRLFRFAFSLILDIIWISFVFLLLFLVSPIFTLSIISFLVVAIALTFKDLISNIAAGVMVLTSQVFEPGDLINTNGAEGIVEEITLNYTKIREFDGVLIYLPNKNIYESSITKYTHKKFKAVKKVRETTIEDKKKAIVKYVGQLKKLIETEKKTTSYVKQIEIIGTVNPMELDNNLSKVFDKYEPILGKRATYNVDNTTFDRCVISLRINSNNSDLVFKYTDAFLQDVLFELNHEQVFMDWDKYLSEKNRLSGGKEVSS